VESTSAFASRASSVSAVALRSPSPRFVVSAWVTSSSQLLSPTFGTSRVFHHAWATCWTWHPKDLEKVIYFAAYMIITVDEEARHREMPELEKELQQEIKQLEKERDALLADRMKELETALAELEASNAKADQKRKTDDAGKKELAAIRKNFDDDIAHLERVWDDFRSLTVGNLRAEDAVFQDVQDRYGMFFTAHMGAEAIRQRLETFDLQQVRLRAFTMKSRTEKASARSVRSSASRSSTLSCKRVLHPPRWCSRQSRSFRRSCAPWSSWMVAVSLPPT